MMKISKVKKVSNEEILQREIKNKKIRDKHNLEERKWLDIY